MGIQDKPTALVLGATGTIGRALVAQLADDAGPEGLRARAAVRRPD